jgi:hypothetical protein
VTTSSTVSAEPIDLPHPNDLAAEGERFIHTLVGVAIGAAGMLLADRLRERAPAASGT